MINEFSINKITKEFGGCKEFVWLLKLAGFYESLKGKEDFTVLAPLDGAFRQLSDRVTARLLKPENITALRSLLALHLVKGRFTLKELREKETVSNLVDVDLRFNQLGNGFYVNSVRIIKADKPQGNSIVHVIDRVLLPSKNK